MFKKIFYGLLSLLLFVLILEHFYMSSIFSAAFRQVGGSYTNSDNGGRFSGESYGGSVQDNNTTAPEDEESYNQKLEALADLPKIYKKGLKELRDLEMAPAMTPQAAEIKSFLEWFFSVPWTTYDPTEINIKKAKEVLDRDHKGLDKIKDRILEYLAVQKRVPNGKAPILCFVGPPGVGKTTLAKSIAESMGRKFVRISLGGVRDEASIRGFIRTYIGSKPGKIVEALKEAGTMNPVILLDEIDKIAAGGHNWGDPSACLLEVLDPSQNKDFKDHYLEMGIDLSQVIFIATANSTEIHPALLNRMEVIELSAYTPEEKMDIARDYLLPKVKKENGLKPEDVKVSDDALSEIISKYALEPGVRELERELDKICRKIIKSMYDGKKQTSNITPKELPDMLGKPMFNLSTALKQDTIGQVNGLAVLSFGGGSVDKFEAVILPGKGSIAMTGNMEEMTQESIKDALTVAKTLLPNYNMDPRFLEDKDVHVHAPRPFKKDGNSAGVTFTTAILSAVTKIPVRKDVCMTGEITITGEVLAIGGVKDKLIGAYTAGMTTAIIPEENIPDLDEVPQKVKDKLKIVPVKNINQVLKVALAR